MKKIKDFLNRLFEKEQKAIDAGNYKNRFDEYNSYAREIKTHMSEPTVGLGLPVLEKPKPDFFYEESFYPLRRHLYKISKYKNSKYEKLWVCYVSVANPYNNIKSYDSVFIVSEIENNLKIIAKFNKDYDTNRWKFSGGDRELDYYNLGELVNVHRIMAPDDDEWSMKEHIKEA